MFFEVLVVHFMRPANGADIGVVAAGKPFKPLVNDHFVHQKIRDTVQCKSRADGDAPVLLVNNTQHDEQPARHRKNEEEGIVLFKKAGAFVVMVFVEVPQKTVHYITVHQPGNAFHEQEGNKGDRYVN